MVARAYRPQPGSFNGKDRGLRALHIFLALSHTLPRGQERLSRPTPTRKAQSGPRGQAAGAGSTIQCNEWQRARRGKSISFSPRVCCGLSRLPASRLAAAVNVTPGYPFGRLRQLEPFHVNALHESPEKTLLPYAECFPCDARRADPDPDPDRADPCRADPAQSRSRREMNNKYPFGRLRQLDPSL